MLEIGDADLWQRWENMIWWYSRATSRWLSRASRWCLKHERALGRRQRPTGAGGEGATTMKCGTSDTWGVMRTSRYEDMREFEDKRNLRIKGI